ncbi:uncharacterized protein LOC128184291 isoform X2 [Crassostrea angulata]|nr:uncharacterized protein LOC128184291 isoform X2 [Crassostrea angulata]
MGNETSSPERTKKNAVFESPVIIPHPDKELDDGGVYKGDHSDRILKVSEILRRSLEMDITENDESSGDVILRNVTENDGEVSEEPQSPTFRSSVTIHLTPCIKTLEPTDHESTSKENTESIKTSGQPSPSVDRPVGENDQVIEENIDNTISNVCMSRAAAEPSLCNGDTSGMSENSSTGVTSELEEDEIVAVTRVPYHRGNSNIDDYIERAKKLALKSNGCPAGAPDSEDNVVPCNGSDNVDNGVIDVIESNEVINNHSEPVLDIEVIQKGINGELLEENSKVTTEEQVQEVLPEKQLDITIDKEREPDNLETKVLSEIIQKEEIQRQTSSEEHREKSKKKQSPLSKIGSKFNDALKTIKTKRRESMEKSKHRASGAYAAEHDFTVKHASPTQEKSAIQWDDAERNKLNALHPNGISYEGATQKAYAICSEYACVVRKPGSSGMIELSPEIVEHKESESEYDTDSEIDTDLIMKASAPQTEAERQGPLYVGLIVRDVKEDEKAKLCEENIEVCVQNAPNESFDENVINLVNGENKDTLSQNETKPDIESEDTTVIQDTESEDKPVNRDVESVKTTDIANEESVKATVIANEESVKTTAIPNEESKNAAAILNEETENSAVISNKESEDATVIPNKESEDATVIPNKESEDATVIPNRESEDATAIPNEESENAAFIPKEESVTSTVIPNVETEITTVIQTQKDVIAEEETIKRLETETMTEEKTTEATQNTPSPTKVKKKNSILKYLLHRESPKKGKKKDKSAKTPTSETKASSGQKEKPEPESADKQEVEAGEPTLMYVECREKEIVAAQAEILDSEPKQRSESQGSEFEEIDLASTSEQQPEESLPTEDVESSIVPVKSEREVNIRLPEDDVANDSMDLNMTGSSDHNEIHTDENTDSAKSDFNDSGISDYHGTELQIIKQEESQRPVEEKTEVDDVNNESSEKFDFDQNQAVVIDVTCADDIISESEMVNDVHGRQEKRKLPDEENDFPELPSPSESPAGGAPASVSAKSSPTRKKKKKRVNSLSAKISDFFGVAEFRRRISTSSNRSDKSPQEDRNVWSSEEKKSERKQSGSSIHEDIMESRIQENEGTCSEIEEEITPKRSLEAKSMPMLNVEQSSEKHEGLKTGSQTMHVKSRGKPKSKSSTKSSFLESFGLYTSKPKKRPVISSPIKQQNRKSLFDEDINIDVDQDLHIISLSDDEDDKDRTSKSKEVKVISKETYDDVIANGLKNDVKEESGNSSRNEKESEVGNVADKQTVLDAGVTHANVETSREDEKFVASEISVDENNVINGVSQADSKLSPGEYVSLKNGQENQVIAEEMTDYLKFEQDCVVSSPNVESTEKGLNVDQTKSQIDNDEENLSACEKFVADVLKGTNSVENAVDDIRCEEDKILDKTEKKEELKVENESKNVLTVNNDAANESVSSNDGNETREKISQEDVDSGKGDISESSEKKTDKNEHIVPTQNNGLETEAGNEAPGCDSVGGSEPCPSEPSNRVTVVATIETLPVSKDTDLRDSVSPEMCQDTDGDSLRNNAEYDSINMGEERTVAIENPNYCSTCQVKNKSPSDTVDDLHSQAQIDVSGESTDGSKTIITAESSEVRKSSSAAARSASMEELTVHSSHIYEEIEKKKPVIYRRFSDKSENRKVICTSPDPDGKKLKKKKSRSSSFSEFFRNPTKYKMPAWRNKKSKEVI